MSLAQSGTVTNSNFASSVDDLLYNNLEGESEDFSGSPHSFERSSSATGSCIVCRESVSFFTACYCTVCSNVCHTKCLARVPDSCRVPTDVYFVGKQSSGYFECVPLAEQKYLQKIFFTHQPNTIIGVNDKKEAFEFVVPTTAQEQPISIRRPIEPLDKKAIKEVVAGANFTLFLTESGHIYSLGVNTEGQLGIGPDVNEVNKPTLLVNFLGKRISKVTCGGNHCMALTSKKEIYSWGAGRHGRLGHGNQDNQFLPHLLELSTNYNTTNNTTEKTLDLITPLPVVMETTTSGTSPTTTTNNNNNNNNSNLISNFDNCIIACGWSHSIIVVHFNTSNNNNLNNSNVLNNSNNLNNGNNNCMVFTFGRGDQGQLGHNSTENELRPRIVKELSNMKIISADGGYYHSVYLNSEGQVLVNGFGGEGQCGQGDTESKLIPVFVSKLTKKVSGIYSGSFSNTAVTSSGAAYIWGRVGTANYLSPEIIVELNAQIIQSVVRGIFESMAALVRGASIQRRKTALTASSANFASSSNANLLSSTTSPSRKPTNLKPEIKPKERTESLMRFQLLRIVYIQQILNLYDNMNTSLNTQITEKLQKQQSLLDKQQRVNMLRNRIDKYKERVNNKQQEYETTKLNVMILKENYQSKLNRIDLVNKELNSQKVTLLENQTNIEKQREILKTLNKHIDLRTLKLLKELKFVFPIKQSPTTGEFSICGLVVPNLPTSEEIMNSKDPYPKHDKELVAAGLGAICQVVIMISQYSQIPMKYEMIAFGSRSVIVDCISNKGDTVYKCPLFPTQKLEYLHYASVLLNTNIEQLLDYFGLEMVGLGHTLPNLQKLLDHFEADTISANFYDKIRQIRNSNVKTSNSNNNNV